MFVRAHRFLCILVLNGLDSWKKLYSSSHRRPKTSEFYWVRKTELNIKLHWRPKNNLTSSSIPIFSCCALGVSLNSKSLFEYFHQFGVRSPGSATSYRSKPPQSHHPSIKHSTYKQHTHNQFPTSYLARLAYSNIDLRLYAIMRVVDCMFVRW